MSSNDKLAEYKQYNSDDIDSSITTSIERSKFITNDISQRSINWYGYKQQGYINNDTDLNKITSFDTLYKDYINNNNSISRAQLYNAINSNNSQDGADIVVSLIKLLDRIQAKDTIEYIVIFIYTLIDVSYTTSSTNTLLPSNMIIQLYTNNRYLNNDYYTVFLKVISNLGNEKYHIEVVNTAALILALLLSISNNINNINENSTPLINFDRFIINKLTSFNSNNNTKQLLSISNILKILLRSNISQSIFIKFNGINVLYDIISNNQHIQHTQLLYTVGFNLWLLSYNSNVLQPFIKLNIINRLCYIVRSTSMEKLIRIYYAIFKNILLLINGISPDQVHDNNIQQQSQNGFTTKYIDKQSSTEVIESMIGNQLLMTSETILKKRYKDVDLINDVEYVLQQLRLSIDQLSNFELYSSELISGLLTWSPAHTNTLFWRDNINKFDNDDYKLVKRLIELLADNDDTVREIAAHDIGEIAAYHTNGKQLVNKYGGKTRLMTLLQDKNNNVKKQALTALQKLLVNNWEQLQKQSAQGVQAVVSQGKK